MGGMKRKASGKGPSERPAKLSKRSTSSTVGVSKEDTLPRAPLPPVRIGSRKKTDNDVPGLRRAETLPLEGDIVKGGSDTASSAEEPVTSLRKLPSGSSVGVTTSETSVTKLTSKKSSLIRHESLSLSKSSSVRSQKGETNAIVSDGEEAAAVAPPMPPGGLMEIVFSFDTTGSMSSCLDQVRGRVSDMIQRLQADIPHIRLAVFAHGDYCDARMAYVTKWIDFGATLPELCDFVQNVEGTGGGDFDECYELVMRQVQEELSWTPGSRRSLVMIGDATPHGPDYPANKLKIEWKAECKKLRDMGVRIYAVQAKNNNEATSFYSSMAAVTGGKHLQLDEFANIFDMMMAICYREGGGDLLQVYEDEVRAREGRALHKDLEGLFGGLRAEGAGKATKAVPRAKMSKPVVKAAPRCKKSKPVVKAAAKKAPAKPSSKKAKTKPTGPKVKDVANAKTKAKSVPSSSRKFQKKRSRNLRENATEREFRQSVQNVTWSKWHLALQLTSDTDNPDLWRKRGGKKVGFRRVGLFRKHTESAALFEIGVQVNGKGKLFVVFLARKDELKPRASWEAQLISTNAAIKQLEAVLQTNSARVFIRRGIRWARSRKEQIRETDKVEDTLRQRFDYAWSADRSSRKPRSLRRRNVYISKNVL